LQARVTVPLEKRGKTVQGKVAQGTYVPPAADNNNYTVLASGGNDGMATPTAAALPPLMPTLRGTTQPCARGRPAGGGPGQWPGRAGNNNSGSFTSFDAHPLWDRDHVLAALDNGGRVSLLLLPDDKLAVV
jgi:hypothetical protein